MEGALKELAPVVAPVPVEEVLAAIDGRPSVFDRDAKWRSDYGGDLVPLDTADYSRCDAPTVFDGRCLAAGARAIAFLAPVLPVGDPRLAGLARLDAEIAARLANPELMLFCCVTPDGSLGVEGELYVPPGYEKYEHLQGVDAHELRSVLAARWGLEVEPAPAEATAKPATSAPLEQTGQYP